MLTKLEQRTEHQERLDATGLMIAPPNRVQAEKDRLTQLLETLPVLPLDDFTASVRYVYVIDHPEYNAGKIGIGKVIRLFEMLNYGWHLEFLLAPTLLAAEVESAALRRIRREYRARQGVSKANMPQGGASETFMLGPVTIKRAAEVVHEEYTRLKATASVWL